MKPLLAFVLLAFAATALTTGDTDTPGVEASGRQRHLTVIPSRKDGEE